MANYQEKVNLKIKSKSRGRGECRKIGKLIANTVKLKVEPAQAHENLLHKKAHGSKNENLLENPVNKVRY